MVYYGINSRKIVWFGIFWLVCPKYHLWGIFPTQFLSKNTNFISEFKDIEKSRFLKFTVLLYTAHCILLAWEGYKKSILAIFSQFWQNLVWRGILTQYQHCQAQITKFCTSRPQNHPQYCLPQIVVNGYSCQITATAQTNGLYTLPPIQLKDIE